MIEQRTTRTGWLVLAWLAATGAVAAESTALDGYLAGMNTWSASFVQTVEDSKGKRIGTGKGRLIIVRPGRFRWESSPEGAGDAAQLLVADGANLWFFDSDLEQATVKPLAEALPQSPAMLLAGGQELRAAFAVKADGRQDGLDWVQVKPQDAQSDFSEARFGFRGRELTRLLIIDKLGQRTALQFSGVQRNAAIDPALVRFELPEGVDLIGRPVVP